MTYVTRSHLAASAIVPSSDYNQAMDNEAALKAGLQPVQFTMTFDGSGTTIAASTRLGAYYNMPTMSISWWDVAEISSPPSAGSIYFNLWACEPSALATIGSANSIIGSGSRPLLTAGSFRAGASPVGWTTTCIVQGQYAVARVDGASAGAKVALTFYGTRAV